VHRENFARYTVTAIVIPACQLPLDPDICAKTCAAFTATVADKIYHARITIQCAVVMEK
jgi:hypothetical protein